jgi:hypothetical protein
MRKQVLALIIGLLLALSLLSALTMQIKPALVESVYATTIFSNGFEEGQFNPSPGAWTGNTTSPTVQSTIKNSGTYAASLYEASTGSTVYKDITGVAEVFVRFYWRASAALVSGDQYHILWFGTTDPLQQGRFDILRNGTGLFYDVQYRYNGGIKHTSVSTTATETSWQCFELRNKIDASNGTEAIYENGTAKINVYGFQNNDYGTTCSRIQLDASKESGTSGYYTYYDDVVIADTYTGPISSLTQGDGVASSWTYRISQNSTSCYLIKNDGTNWDHSSDPATMINNALWNCSTSGGSIYVYNDTYTTNTPIGNNMGSKTLYNNWFSNITLEFGANTTITRTSISGDPAGDYMFILYNPLINQGDGTINFTLTSNGTLTFDAQGYACGANIFTVFNSTFDNVTWKNLYGEGINVMRARYCIFANITVYSYDQTIADQGMFTGGCIQYCNFTNLNLDGNNQANSRGGFFLDNTNALTRGTTSFVGSFFNNVTKLWIHNVARTGIYLSGDVSTSATDGVAHNNTFSNCTIENTWSAAYTAIKIRPAINNTLTNIVIRNCTNAVTTGTGYDPGPYGNCTGNYVQATINGCTIASLVLTADGNSIAAYGGIQLVANNFFNLTDNGSKHTYFASGTNASISNNTVYMNFTDSQGAIDLDSGNFTNNTFYLNFTRCGSLGTADIYHQAGWSGMIGNTFNVYATSGNSYGLLDFTNGTQSNYAYYPYSYSGPPPVLVTLTITSPTNTTYTSSTISVQLSASVSGSTLDKIWWSCKNGTSWVYASNNTYTVTTQMTGFVNSAQYTFYAWANATDGTTSYQTVMFSVSISSAGIVQVTVNSWWSNWW